MHAHRAGDIWTRTRARRRIFLVALAVIALVAGLFAAETIRRHVEGEAELASVPAFYRLAETPSVGQPGGIVDVERIASAPFGATAWRLVYHSRDLAGDDVPVSAVLIVPDSPAPMEGRTIVSWAHPTTGAAVQCAPSLGVDPFELIAGLHEFLLEGYAIVATDYPGLGVDGASSYLLGVPASNSVLDAVRAARNIEDAEIGDRVILWGHSQGGQAALFAAERASTYAPELDLLGVAVAAPAADLAQLMSDDIPDISGVTIASYAIPAYQAAYADRYPADQLTSILTPAGAAATPEMADLCLLSQNEEIHAIAAPLVGGYVVSDPATTEPWKTLLTENSAGGDPISVPVFVGQGLADELVKPAATEEYVSLLCSQATDVSFHRYTDVDHGFAAYASLPDVLLWTAELSEGRTPTNTCR